MQQRPVPVIASWRFVESIPNGWPTIVVTVAMVPSHRCTLYTALDRVVPDVLYYRYRLDRSMYQCEPLRIGDTPIVRTRTPLDYRLRRGYNGAFNVKLNDVVLLQIRPVPRKQTATIAQNREQPGNTVDWTYSLLSPLKQNCTVFMWL